MKRKIAAGITAAALAVGSLVWAAPAMAEEVADSPPVEVVEETAPVEAVTTEDPATVPEEAPAPAPADVPAEAPVSVTVDIAPLAEEGPSTYGADHSDKKVWVCKYVGKPYVDERLKEGKNPIEVSVSTLKGFTGTFPWEFADQHGQSIAVSFSEKWGQSPDCPEPRTPRKVTPPVPTFEDPCGVNNLTVATVETEGVIWSTNTVGNKTKVAATAAEGYVLEGPASWEFTDSNTLCPPVITQCETTASNHYVTLGDWDFSQTRATGHYELVEGGLRVWTEGNTSTDKVAAYRAVSFPLSDLGEGFSLAVTNNSDGTIAPGLQIVLSTGQILVYEPGAYGVGNVWSNQVVPGLSAGMGYTSFGHINAILAAAPDAQVSAIGFSLGSGVKGDWTITGITVGCVLHTFDAEPEQPEQPEPKVVVERDVPNCEDLAFGDVRVTTTTTEYVWDEETEAWVEESEPDVDYEYLELTEEERALAEAECPLTPGDITSVCVGDVPYLSYGVTLPEGYFADSETPVTITFSDGVRTYEVPGTHALEGTILWPGASAGDPQQWPGWSLVGGEYVNVGNDNFGWTREGVTVTFDVNPSYSTTVEYPEASALCANPPVKTTTPTTPAPASLAATGSDMGIMVPIGAGILTALGFALILTRRLARR